MYLGPRKEMLGHGSGDEPVERGGLAWVPTVTKRADPCSLVGTLQVVSSSLDIVLPFFLMLQTIVADPGISITTVAAEQVPAF